MPTLALAVAGSLALAACDDDPAGVEEHGDATQVQLVMNGSVVATFTFATNAWVGELEVTQGTETPHIDVNFLDDDGDVIVYDSEFYLQVDVEDPTIASFEQDTPGEFGGHLHGEAVGDTDVTFSLLHGSVGAGHADLVTTPVHAHVIS
jgi:hypothetical protein